MSTAVVISLGSFSYIADYAKFLAEYDPKAKLLVIDKLSSSKEDLPVNAIYLKVSLRNPLSKIVSYCSDNSFKVLGVINRHDYFETLHSQVCGAFDVVGPSSSAVQNLSDKTRMHELMVKSELAFYRPISIVTTLDEVPEYFDQLQFPFVLKTRFGAKSRGVFTLRNPKDYSLAKEILTKRMKHSQYDRVLIEQYLYGKQVAPAMYVNEKGKVRILALVDIITGREVKQKHMQLVYRTTPSQHKERILQKITYVMQTLVDAAGLKSTCLHPEFFVIGKHVYLIEVNVRIAGFRDVMMKLAYNIDMNRLSWELAMNLPVSQTIKGHSSCTACEVWEDESGVVRKLALPKSKYIMSVKAFYEEGDTYTAPPQKQVPLALFFVKSPDDSLEIAKKIRKQTKIVII